MSARAFSATLAPVRSRIVGGYGASGAMNPDKIADDLFKGEIPGPWLCCYMLRRFGWPNSGSDDYKELCSWVLTTPMPGLFLYVDPYLGGSNLHFGIRFNSAVRSALECDPGRDAFFARREKAIRSWWKTTGRRLYVWGLGTKVGDEDELVKAYNEKGDEVYGLWKRTPHNSRAKGRTAFSPGGPRQIYMVLCFLGDFLKEKHPEVKLPRMTKRERERRTSAFHVKAQNAIRATLRDLLRPTNVRDISFTPFGDIERTEAARERYTGQESTGYFAGAGYAPSYWYDPKNRQAIAKNSRR